mgnify:CR=1 FL=1
MTKIDHAAVRTAHYEEAQKFFEDVFDMHMWREIGEKPGRKCWFKEGIQLCETSEIAVSSENGYDHISLAVDSVPEIMERSKHILLPLLTTTGSPFQMEQRSN